jgi:hypothetical protein
MRCKRHRKDGRELGESEVPGVQPADAALPTAGFRESGAKDDRVVRFPQDKKPLPKETKDAGRPLGAGIGNVTKGIQEHMGVLKVGPED